MDNYSYIKKYDILSGKNTEETEERNEIVDVIHSEPYDISIKNIHNKRKQYR